MTVSSSSIYTATAPALVGVWVFDPTAPDASERQYIHADGRSESLDPGDVEIELVGRENPLVEYGEVTLVGLKLTIFVPFDGNHDAAVEYWRQATLNRRALCYRDNRKRLMYGAIVGGGPAFTDGRVGTAIGLTLRRVDYDEAV